MTPPTHITIDGTGTAFLFRVEMEPEPRCVLESATITAGENAGCEIYIDAEYRPRFEAAATERLVTEVLPALAGRVA